jgi:L-aminopeptidase/D-esterase-like protein
MNRRRFVGALGAAAIAQRRLFAERVTPMPPMQPTQPMQSSEGWITDVDGIKVGHFTDARRPTGCTVVLYEQGAVAGVDVRGSAPGTRETDLLKPVNLVDRVNAVVLSGGSAFGLDSATGVMRWLEEHDAGFATGAGKVPIVPAAILYDLGVGDPKIRPTAESGYQACRSAGVGPVAEGNVGAGAGATVGKLAAGRAMKGGIGTASIKLSNGLVVAAIVAVNCTGDVVDPHTGKIVAGARTADGHAFVDIAQSFRAGRGVALATARGGAGESTTIGVVATNARFDKTQMTKIAEMAHDGLARTINPAHTPYDGDTLFAMTTGRSTVAANLTAIGALAAEVVSDAILRGVRKATSIPGYTAARDL